MAEGEIDIGQLTEDQQLALQQFTSVTDQEIGAAVPLLRRCEWNVQIAIARFFDGEPPEPAPQAVPDAPPPASIRRQEVLLNGFSDVRRRSRHVFEPAPRVVGQPENQINQRPPLILSLVFTPVNIIFGLFSRLYNLFSHLFPFLPRLLSRLSARSASSALQQSSGDRSALGPQANTERFLRDFTAAYGNHPLPLQPTSYARAFDLAKSDLKFLLVIPLSPEHDQTDAFVRNILLSEQVVEFVTDPSNNVILWAGSVADSEPYQVATALNVTQYPTAVLIAHTPSVSSTAMSVLARLTSPHSPQNAVRTLRLAIDEHSEPLNRARASKAEQQASRSLREEQNSAYERSLAKDRERARAKREAEQEKQRKEEEEKSRIAREQRYAQDVKSWRRWRASQVAPEPAKDAKDVVRVSVRLPNGEKVLRRFAAETSLEEVYGFVECFEEVAKRESGTDEIEKTPFEPSDFQHRYDFRLVSPMPREVYDIEKGGTVKQRIGRSANLIAERIEDDGDEA